MAGSRWPIFRFVLQTPIRHYANDVPPMRHNAEQGKLKISEIYSSTSLGELVIFCNLGLCWQEQQISLEEIEVAEK